MLRGSESEAQAPSEREFIGAVDKEIASTFAGLDRDFGQKKSTYDRLPFHNRAHSEAVTKRTKIILETIQGGAPELVPNRDIKLAELVAANHDTVQNWKENMVNGQRKRQRFIEQNEQDSFQKLKAKLDAVNSKSGQNFFTPQDLKLAEEAISTFKAWE